jgi:hypothetical protein
VTCISASECWAVGQYDAGIATTGDFQTLTERWDGTAWTIINSPNASATEPNYLNSITCSSAADCWAVGYYITAGTFETQTLIERWNGSAWAIVSSPNTSPTQINQLNSATCAAPSDCWAVGRYGGSDGDRPLIERWDGTAWAIVPSPNNGTQSYLYSVTCSSASSCWAVGYYYTTDNADQTLIEHWDGTAWAIVSSPNTSATQTNILYGVTCASASDCWAVGDHADNVSQTLTERYAPLTPTSVVSRKTHGSVGDFDINLPLVGTPGIECRSGSVPDSHRVVTTFAAPVTVTNATVTPGPGGTASISLVPGANHNQVIVTLSNVSNAQTLTINLLGVSDGSNTGDVHIRMSVLLGDTTADGSVNSADIGQTKSQSGHAVTSSNFREDVTVDGSINSADIGLMKSKSGTALP